MEIYQAFRYELKPSKLQKQLFIQHAGTARWAYNYGLDRKIKQYELTKTSPLAIDLHKEIVILKRIEQFKWLREISKIAPQEALRNLDKAFSNFFKRVKQGKKPGFPKFKKRGGRDSFSCSERAKIKGEFLVHIPKIGKVKTKESTKKFMGIVKDSAVCREADRWFISFMVKRDREISKNNSTEIVGVDLGLNSFAVISNGEVIKAPKPLKASLKRLQRKQKQHAKKQKGSKNREKSKIVVSRLHRKIKNIRLDFLHKVTTKLAKTKSVIVIENLAVSGMLRNHKLARSISDASWGEFRRQLEYKTIWYDSKLVIADKFFPSSKLCSSCGSKKAKLELSEREYICENCGLSLDRDLNAAINLKQNYTGSSPGINACGDGSSGSNENLSETTVSEARNYHRLSCL